MSVLLGADTRVLVQGITGNEGSFHARKCREYGTKIVAGVTPGKGGQNVEGIPVFDTVEVARRETGADASMTLSGDAMSASALISMRPPLPPSVSARAMIELASRRIT